MNHLNDIYKFFAECMQMAAKSDLYDLLLQQLEAIGDCVFISKNDDKWVIQFEKQTFIVEADSFPKAVAEAHKKYLEMREE